MNSLLTVKDVKNIRLYLSGFLIAHILALRINTSGSCDLIVTDYSSNSDTISEWNRENFYGGREFPRDQLLHLEISMSLVQKLCSEYNDSTNGADLFDAADRDSSWIDICERFAIAHLVVNLRKRENVLTGAVKDVTIASIDNASEAGTFWERFLSLTLQSDAGLISILPSEVIKRLQGSMYSADAETTDEGQVKAEHQESEIDSQLNLKDFLEDASQYTQKRLKEDNEQLTFGTLQISSLQRTNSLLAEPVSQGLWAPSTQRSQLLTQVPSLHSHSEEAVTDEQHRPLSFILESCDSTKTHFSLADLSGIPLTPNNRVYRTQAIVVGSVPAISRVVTKSCFVKNQKFTLSDPRTSGLELIIADDFSVEDNKTKILSSRNSLVIHLAADEVLQFFGAEFDEQLYPRLQDIERRFLQRKPKVVPLQLIIVEVNGVCLWKPQNLTFDKII